MEIPNVTISGHLGFMYKNPLCLVLYLDSWLEIFIISQYDDLIIITTEVKILIK